ncbi:MAG: thymidine phosphorylase [Bifidobacteriaceae bacterium]|nr:thymidine phosphorylase [Bifidobacteriaceae bacterium]
MSTNANNASLGSVHSSGSSFTSALTGSKRPSRPTQLNGAFLDQLSNGLNPESLLEISHASAASLLHKVRQSEDPEIVQRVLTLVENEGIDLIAELWSNAEPESLPGILWRLYLLRQWAYKQNSAIIAVWKIGEPQLTTASVIAGVNTPPKTEDIIHTADDILSGVFSGDFSMALERASVFCEVIARGLQQIISQENNTTQNNSNLSTAKQLQYDAQLFHKCALLWNTGKLE